MSATDRISRTHGDIDERARKAAGPNHHQATGSWWPHREIDTEEPVTLEAGSVRDLRLTERSGDRVVTAGKLGDETRYEYAVTGDTVSEAMQRSDLAKPLPSGIAASAEVVDVGAGERSRQPTGRIRLPGTKADTPCHVTSESR